MKTLILLTAFLFLAFHGGMFVLAIHTKHIARARMLLHLIGDRFDVAAKVTPLWGLPETIGSHQYCDRMYSIAIQVSR